MRIVQPSNGKGSLRDIQLLVNKHQKLVDDLLRKSFPAMIEDEIIWVSPIEKDEFAEYRDKEFLKAVGLSDKALDGFWPLKGPQWDALARTDSGKVILVEAKANIPEIVSPASVAGPKSKALIEKSLNATKAFLNINNDVDWSGKFYQYTNRLAHLYHLREVKQKPAFLVNIYFIGDETVSGPKTEDEWKAAITVVKTYLGISRHKLSRYTVDLFIHVNELKGDILKPNA